MKLAFTALRLLIGLLFVGHGTQKLFGWFGGHGLKATGDAFDGMGLSPGREKAALAGASEAGGGVLLAAGLATPLAAAAITGTMVQAIRSAHADKGVWASDGGWEYNAVVIAIVLTLAEQGPGPISLDKAFGLKLHGPALAIGALAAGLVGPTLVDGVLAKTVTPADADTGEAASA
ncbi:MAG: DoxX family protein [Solirubrobacterales bacterium]